MDPGAGAEVAFEMRQIRPKSWSGLVFVAATAGLVSGDSFVSAEFDLFSAPGPREQSIRPIPIKKRHVIRRALLRTVFLLEPSTFKLPGSWCPAAIVWTVQESRWRQALLQTEGARYERSSQKKSITSAAGLRLRQQPAPFERLHEPELRGRSLPKKDSIRVKLWAAQPGPAASMYQQQ
jgi:hypothetical protein